MGTLLMNDKSCYIDANITKLNWHIAYLCINSQQLKLLEILFKDNEKQSTNFCFQILVNFPKIMTLEDETCPQRQRTIY